VRSHLLVSRPQPRTRHTRAHFGCLAGGPSFRSRSVGFEALHQWTADLLGYPSAPRCRPAIWKTKATGFIPQRTPLSVQKLGVAQPCAGEAGGEDNALPSQGSRAPRQPVFFERALLPFCRMGWVQALGPDRVTQTFLVSAQASRRESVEVKGRRREERTSPPGRGGRTRVTEGANCRPVRARTWSHARRDRREDGSEVERQRRGVQEVGDGPSSVGNPLLETRS